MPMLSKNSGLYNHVVEMVVKYDKCLLDEDTIAKYCRIPNFRWDYDHLNPRWKPFYIIIDKLLNGIKLFTDEETKYTEIV